MSSSIAQAIMIDAEDRIWLSTQHGVYLFKLEGNQLVELKRYDKNDGLQDNFFKNDASVFTRDSAIIFASVNGLTVFQPTQLQADRLPPNIVLTGFRLFNKNVPIGDLADGRTILHSHVNELQEIDLNYRDKVFSIEFLGIHFDAPEKIRYAYRLEGFDDDWVFTDPNQRIVTYTDLPHENYTFHVKAISGDGVWSSAKSIKINIAPPFWKTGVAYIIYFITGIGLFYFALRITRLRAEFKHKLELEKS